MSAARTRCSGDHNLQARCFRDHCTVKSIARVAVSKRGIIGSFGFENEAGETFTATKERYIVVFNKFWRALGARHGVNRGVSQQDETTPHTVNITMEWLDHRLPNRLIRKRCKPEWSPHSLNMNARTFISALLEGQRVWEQSSICCRTEDGRDPGDPCHTEARVCQGYR